MIALVVLLQWSPAPDYVDAALIAAAGMWLLTRLDLGLDSLDRWRARRHGKEVWW